MKLHFYKYHGTGNDFILLDNRSGNIQFSQEQIALMCNRHIGIGADGLMLVEEVEEFDFRMVYYNADGRESTMCGNGGRCITAFAKRLGIVRDEANFIATDGPHKAILHSSSMVSLQMQDVKEIHDINGSYVLDTGSPHFIKWVDEVEKYPVFVEGRAIRNLDAFKPDGINVNFAERMGQDIYVRTYERGVENETLSCGTGVTASAIAATGNNTGLYNISVKTPGGKLTVTFEKDTATTAKNVVLTGPAVFVFEGEIEIG
jgi:diaminopimelate epimerase